MSAKRLSFCAMSVALATVTSMIRLFHFPFGGSVTLLSMLFITLPAWFFGVWEGVVCGLLFGLIQYFLDPCFITIPQFFLDYILAFSVMGVAGFFKNAKNGLLIGYIVAIVARWIVASFAGLVWVSLGYTAWEGWSPLPYSMAYNGAYIFAEGIITVIILLIRPVQKGLKIIKTKSQV